MGNPGIIRNLPGTSHHPPFIAERSILVLSSLVFMLFSDPGHTHLIIPGQLLATMLPTIGLGAMDTFMPLIRMMVLFYGPGILEVAG